MEQSARAFFSYSRDDSGFALRLAEDLRAAGASVWLDQLDIAPGERWDRAVEDALTNCSHMIVILSPASVNSKKVMDEVSFALEEQKTVIPVTHRDSAIPLLLRRVQQNVARRLISTNPVSGQSPDGRRSVQSRQIRPEVTFGDGS